MFCPRQDDAIFELKIEHPETSSTLPSKGNTCKPANALTNEKSALPLAFFVLWVEAAMK